jgi:hypothetical protein
MTLAVRLDHVVSAVPDWESATDFCRRVIGADVIDRGAGVALPRALPRRRRLQPALETSLRTLDQLGTARGNTSRRKVL